MNEVTKLYENAGVSCKPNYIYNKVPILSGLDYPPFTAEKQLLLIQWLAETRPIHINFSFDKWTIEGMVRYGIKYDTFKDALSGYINQIWQSLTEEKHKQVKGILE